MLKSIYGQPYLVLTLAVSFWSINFIVGRAVHLDVPPVGLAWWRWAGALILLTPFAWRHLRGDWPALRAGWRVTLLCALTGIAVFNTLVYMGLHHTQAINAALLQSAMPSLIVLLAFVSAGDLFRPVQLMGLLLSTVGVLTVVTKGDPGVLINLSLNKGDLMVLVAVICYAVYSVAVRKRPAVHPLSFLWVIFALGLGMLTPFYVQEHLSGLVMRFDKTVTLGAVAYVAVFPSILSYLFFNRGVELVGPGRAGLFIHLLPVFASLLAVAILGETFRWYHGAGLALILGGIGLANRKG
ncbi:DMT family transporter [Magnetospira sp. QH-2]|uniref:DMT family transporter n=1 Tax=Magnetospira sp. (strain QH-2) TaxID=1288970 RepID=UPI0003E81669|nr:DMT family transporter [Magnetospira sp. QH-2]CCQ72044.1 putative permease of the drug/metabolite transporter (DMT) superfamily [Magnetospira sp. QH-2]